MTWVRLDDRAPLDPKLIDVGAEAAWLWVAGIAHANRHTTDGLLVKRQLGVMYPPLQRRVKRLARALVDAGLWVDEGDYYRIANYEKYQEEAMRDAVEERRKQARERKRRQRDRDRHRKQDTKSDGHDVTPRDGPRDSDAGGHATGHVGSRVQDPDDVRPGVSQAPGPSRPVPARPSPTETPPPNPPRGGPGDEVSPLRVARLFDEAWERVHGRALGLDGSGRNRQRSWSVHEWARKVGGDGWESVVSRAAEAAIRSGELDGVGQPFAVFATTPGKRWGGSTRSRKGPARPLGAHEYVDSETNPGEVGHGTR